MTLLLRTQQEVCSEWVNLKKARPLGWDEGVLLSGEHVLICVAWPCEWPSPFGSCGRMLLPPDIQFRFERAIGNKVLMVSGSDEHGTPITVTAEQQGVAPQRVVDEFHAMNYQALLDLGCSWSMSVDPRGVEYGGALFNRTSDPRHKSMVQENFSALEQGGFFERQTMEQYYERNDDGSGRFPSGQVR